MDFDLNDPCVDNTDLVGGNTSHAVMPYSEFHQPKTGPLKMLMIKTEIY